MSRSSRNLLSSFVATRRERDCRAFSLVEVTLAIGIISFGMLAMLGFMPVGLGTMREAMDQTIQAQIVRTVSSEAKLLRFDQIDDFVDRSPLYFDLDGVPQSAENTRTRFRVNLERRASTYPGSGAADLGGSLVTLWVEVGITEGTGSQDEPSAHPIFIPNSGG